MKKHKKSIRRISCDEALRLVFEFIDEELRGKSRAELEYHLEMCRHCFDRVEFEKLLKSRLRKLKVVGNPSALRKRVDSLLEEF